MRAVIDVIGRAMPLAATVENSENPTARPRAEPAASTQSATVASRSAAMPDASIDPGKLAEFVAGQKGAQFTPAGVLKFSLSNFRAEDVLERLKDVLERLGVDAVRVA